MDTNTSGQDSAGFLTQEPARTILNAILRPHRMMPVSITLSMQTAVNRFCPGSGTFSSGPVQYCLPRTFQEQMDFSNACFSTKEGPPLHFRGWAGHNFAQTLWGHSNLNVS